MKKDMEILESARIFKGIEPEELYGLLKLFGAVEKSYRKGEYILKAGESSQRVGLILEGKVHILQDGFWGNRNILSVLERGMNFGEAYACAPGAKLSINVVAEADCRILFLDVSSVFKVTMAECQDSVKTLILNLLEDMAFKNVYFTEKITHVGERTTRGKIISYLSSQKDKWGSTDFYIPFSRQELADYLFVDRSGLSAELCRMRDEGLLWFEKNHFRLY